LEQRFGRDRIFKDVDNLRPGADFGEYIKTILPRCRVALILIGPNWVNAQDEDGRRRLEDPHDWVRIEIEIALAAGDLDVVPVLINGARMPRAEELPPSLHPLLRRHAATIRRDPDFRDDIERLATVLRASVSAAVAQHTSALSYEFCYNTGSLLGMPFVEVKNTNSFAWHDVHAGVRFMHPRSEGETGYWFNLEPTRKLHSLKLVLAGETLRLEFSARGGTRDKPLEIHIQAKEASCLDYYRAMAPIPGDSGLRFGGDRWVLLR
jgi:hypothetical protein